MTNSTAKSGENKPVLGRKPSPFNSDPHNNRGGKSGNRGGIIDNGSRKGKSINVPKFKGGSGGDR
jgi:hypothetical protein